MNDGLSDSIRNFVYWWNLNFPIDRWWRKRHKVAFGSSVHREISFLDILVEWEEEALYDELLNQQEYIPNKGVWIKEVADPRTEEEKRANFMNEFKNIDLTQFDD